MVDLNAQIVEPVQNFLRQSERIINVTHKPRGFEYRQIAYVTAAGMLLIGAIGFLISMTVYFLKQL